MTIPNFKEAMAADVTAFINPSEFATLHTIDGRQMWIVVDSDQQGSNIPNMQGAQPPSYAEGASVSQKIIHVDQVELGYMPKEEQKINFDGANYYVKGVKPEDGILMIVLEAYQS